MAETHFPDPRNPCILDGWTWTSLHGELQGTKHTPVWRHLLSGSPKKACMLPANGLVHLQPCGAGVVEGSSNSTSRVVVNSSRAVGAVMVVVGGRLT